MTDSAPTVPPSPSRLRCCAVIPAYNEGERVAAVVRGALEHVQTVLVIDDGSKDNTAEVARAAGAEVIVHDPNQGKGASLVDGFQWAVDRSFEAAIALDADGQHLTTEIPLFLAAAAELDLVVGNRMAERRGMPAVRWHTNRLMSFILSWQAGQPIADSQCGFRLIRTASWKTIAPRILSRNFDFESEMLVIAARCGCRLGAVPVSTVYAGEVSKIRPVRDTIRFIRMAFRLWGQRLFGVDSRRAAKR